MEEENKRKYDDITCNEEFIDEEDNDNNNKKYKKTVNGHQCIFRNNYNCKCSSHDGNGNPNCPSPLSITEALNHGFNNYPSTSVCPAMGKLLV